MDNTSTTDTDNSASAIVDPNVSTEQGTDTSVNNSDSSQSTNVADDTTKQNNINDDSASKFDADLDDWITKRGLAKADSDEQKQAYQDLRNGQREYTKEQQAKQATKSAQALSSEINANKPSEDEENDDLDPLEKDVKAMKDELMAEKTTRLQSEFYTSNKVTDEEHKAIMEIFKEKVNKPTTPEGKRTAFELWSKPDALDDLLDMAKARILRSADTSAIAEEAARKEREKIAKESNASSPSRGAKTFETGNKTPEQERLARFSTWD